MILACIKLIESSRKDFYIIKKYLYFKRMFEFFWKEWISFHKNIDNIQIGILEQFHMDYVRLKTEIMAVEYSVLPSQNKMLINTLKKV